ncbi:MAG: ATP-binding protein [Actinomycetota bacterium]|nr:ATP-binding protein [Actinomycetota bacterium]
MTQVYPATSDAPANARRYCARQLELALADNEDARIVASAAQLIVSELVTNSVNAGGTHVGLRLSVEDSTLRLAVRDNAVGRPLLSDPSPRDTRGRGLQIVDRLCDTWGTTEVGDGKQIWAELELPVSALRVPVLS